MQYYYRVLMDIGPQCVIQTKKWGQTEPQALAATQLIATKNAASACGSTQIRSLDNALVQVSEIVTKS